MNRNERIKKFISDKYTIMNIESIFQKCYLEYGDISEEDAKVFIYYATAFFMCELLDEENINITSSEIVSQDKVCQGIDFNTAIAALTKYKENYIVEYSNDLIKYIQGKNIVGFLYVLNIIGHEVFHIYQYQCIDNKLLKIESLIDSLEYVKRKMDEKYYYDAYNSLHIEVTADLAGVSLSIKFIEMILGRKLTKKERKKMKYIFIENNYKNFDKFLDEEEILTYLNKLIYDVSLYVKDNNNLIKEFPILNTIFNSNGDIRYIDDIINEYEILSSMENIDRKEINKLYTIIVKSLSINNKIYSNKQKKYSY